MELTIQEVQQLLGEKEILILEKNKQIMVLTNAYNELKSKYDTLVEQKLLREVPKNGTQE